ncbi:RNA exonuclease 1 -like protein [Trichinella spiralis]|uniref:RNA exonuclease 1-like protein n=1 Tax=Trichinella spiralis TaxID=6334 RepID=A0A0V1BJ23_TRISP|nr:RNA exonuclease 1 -like protein [Trichinella spiralis]
MNLEKISDKDKLRLCRIYFYGGFGMLPLLWIVNSMWFFYQAFLRKPHFEEQHVIYSMIGAGVWFMCLFVWIWIYQMNRSSWGALGDYISFFSCPFFSTGACNRPYCFFSHQESSKAVHKKTNSSEVNNKSTTAYSNDNNCSSSPSSAAPAAAVAVAYTPTPIAELKKRKEDREKRRKARQLENAQSCPTPCSVEIIDLTKSEPTSSPVSSSSAAEQETSPPVAGELEKCPSSTPNLLIVEEQPISQLKRQKPEEVVEILDNAGNLSTSTPKKIRKVDLFGEDSDDDRLIAFCAVDEDEVEKPSVDETTDQLFQSLLVEKAKSYANVPSVDEDTVLESASVAYEKRKVALEKEASMIQQKYNTSSNIRWSAYKTGQLASTSHQPEPVEKATIVKNDPGAMFSTLPADIKPEKTTTLENNSINAELAIKQLRSVKKENTQKLIKRPVIVPGSHLKIPFTVRQTILNYFIDAFLQQGATEEQALEKAQKEEEFLCRSCQHKMTYNVAAIHRLKRIKDGQLSIRSVSSYSAVDSQVLLDLFYNKLERFVLSLDDLQAHGFPLPDPTNFTRAYFSKKEVAKTYLPVDDKKRQCDRCASGSTDLQHTCCKGDLQSDGCCMANCHVTRVSPESELNNYIHTAGFKQKKKSVFALDCEMVYTTIGSMLARVTVVDWNLETVYERLVKPPGALLDCNTRFSGITEQELAKAEWTLEDVQKDLSEIFSPDSILIGHSLDCDLRALKLIHMKVVDTSVVFPHRRGLPYKRALKSLAMEYLKKIIQENVGGHDSKEDASACMELMKCKNTGENGLSFCLTLLNSGKCLTEYTFSRCATAESCRRVVEAMAAATLRRQNGMLFRAILSAILIFFTIFTLVSALDSRDAVELLDKCRELLNEKQANWKVKIFRRQLFRLCSLAERYVDDSLIVLFCGNAKRYPICQQVDLQLKAELKKRPAPLRPAYIMTDNFAFADDLHVRHFPALTYTVAGRLFHYTGKWNKEEISRWIRQMGAGVARSVDYSNFNQLLNKNVAVMILLYKQENAKCARFAGRWWDRLAKSASDYKQTEFVKLECSGVNGFFAAERLQMTITDDNCPTLLMLYNDKLKLFSADLSEPGVATSVRHFLLNQRHLADGWRPLGDEPTDLEYIEFDMQRRLDSRMNRPVHIVTGFTGGFGVIVLAVSIFWGLKGSAFISELKALRTATVDSR